MARHRAKRHGTTAPRAGRQRPVVCQIAQEVQDKFIILNRIVAMKFVFDARPSDSPLVEAVWHTQSQGGGSFISTAASHWEMVVTKQKDRLTISIRGPETIASPAPIPEDAEFFGIIFKRGAFMPALPKKDLVNGALHLPESSIRAFRLHGDTWQFPNFENADTFVNQLVRAGLLANDQVVEDVLR